MSISDTYQKAIEDFITSPELVQLETRFARFNIFEALSVQRREIYHSSFLAFLLDPYGSHGLRDLFLRRFLQEAVRTPGNPAKVTAVDLDLMDLVQSEIKREQANIDILIRDKVNKLVVVIENKVDSKQHDHQLEKYRKHTENEHPNHKWLGILLSVDNEVPEDPNYVTFTYVRVRELVLEILQRDGVLIGPAVKSTLEQYSDLLGRQFMADAELKEICAKIYKRHKQAIDILVANIPDDREELASAIQKLIADAGFKLDDPTSFYINFIPSDIDLPFFKGSQGWTSSGRLLLFEFVLRKDSISLVLYMGPGDMEKRRIIHAFALKNRPPFKAENKLYPSWQQLYSKQILNSGDYEQTHEQRVATIEGKWNEFMSQDLPKLREKLLSHDWAAETPISA